MAKTGARPGDWKTLPLPEITERLLVGRHFSADEMARIRDGLLPEEMEDKWFIVWENDLLNFHRSWTGICVYEARFANDENGHILVDVIVNRNREQYQSRSDDSDIRLLLWLIEAVILKKPVPLPALG